MRTAQLGANSRSAGITFGRPDPFTKKFTRQASSRCSRQKIILSVLEANRWNRKRTASALKISYRALLYKIRRAGLPPKRGMNAATGRNDCRPLLPPTEPPRVPKPCRPHNPISGLFCATKLMGASTETRSKDLDSLVKSSSILDPSFTKRAFPERAFRRLPSISLYEYSTATLGTFRKFVRNCLPQCGREPHSIGTAWLWSLSSFASTNTRKLTHDIS